MNGISSGHRHKEEQKVRLRWRKRGLKERIGRRGPAAAIRREELGGREDPERVGGCEAEDPILYQTHGSSRRGVPLAWV